MGVTFQSYPQRNIKSLDAVLWALNSHLIPLPHVTVSGPHPQLADLPEPFFGSIVAVYPSVAGCGSQNFQDADSLAFKCRLSTV